MKAGEERGRAAGGGIWEVRLEVGLDVRRGDVPLDEAKGRGESGTLFRSGAILECG